ncbi:MAG: hypothetical protein ACOYMA_00330 [Bacteroidia bacterium]
MQNNIIKLASIELNKSNDIIKTAGILRLLKNKLFNLFDSDKSQKVSRMISYTGSIKPLLNQTYKLIKDIESSIDDLDVDTYNTNIELLKQKVNELNNELNKLNKSLDEDVKVSESEKQRSAIESGEAGRLTGSSIRERERGRQRPREPSLPEGAAMYDGINNLAELGVKKDDIIEGKNLQKFIDSWNQHLKVTRISGEKKGDIHKKQKALNIFDIKSLFYDKIPYMKIIDVLPRELDSTDNSVFGRPGERKPGYCEINVESDLTELPKPLNNWQLKVLFRLVDQRNNTNDTLKYTIYLQKVIRAIETEATEAT